MPDNNPMPDINPIPGNNPMPDTSSLPGPDLPPAPADAARVKNHGGVSGGKDSDALMLWMKYESGYAEETLEFSFSDTGNEAAETYEHIRMLSERVHPITILKPPLDFYDLARSHNRFPTTKARFCTQELKMKPTKAHLEGFMAQGYTVINHSGVRASESADRATLEEWEPAWTSYFGCLGRRPLLRWSLDDVWAIHARYDIPRNPLYDRGCKRVGCFPCIMSRKSEIALIATQMPERIDMLDAAEHSFEGKPSGISTFFSRNMVPVRYRDHTYVTAERTQQVEATPLAPDALPFAPDDFPPQVTVNSPSSQVAIPTIRAVVRWALAGEGFTEALDYDDLEELPTCDSRSGLCE